MGRKNEFVPDDLIKALQRGIPGFKGILYRHQWHLARLIWEAGAKRREHRRLDGYMSIGYQELDSCFGRRGFDAINGALGVFDVTPNWYWSDGRPTEQNRTKGYKLTPLVEQVRDKYLKPRQQALTKLIYLDSKNEVRPLKAIPGAIASKENDDPLGVTVSAWRKAKPLNNVPVHLDLLKTLYGHLEKMDRQQAQGNILSVALPEEIERRLVALGQLIHLAQTDVAGRGYIIHRYAECKTGRLYAAGVSLQTAPRIIRKAALHGLWDYDIENCHFAIFEQLATRYGDAPVAVRHYLANKVGVREGIASRVGISKEQAKTCLLALMFGARTTERLENAIPQHIGLDKARSLYVDADFAALAKDVQAGREVILKAWPKRRTTLINDMGRPVKLQERPEVRMAHIIQGIEAKAIRAAIDLYPDEIVLLMHDGFVSKRDIDVALVEQRMYDATGYRLPLFGGVIDLPPDLGFSKL